MVCISFQWLFNIHVSVVQTRMLVFRTNSALDACDTFNLQLLCMHVAHHVPKFARQTTEGMWDQRILNILTELCMQVDANCRISATKAAAAAAAE